MCRVVFNNGELVRDGQKIKNGGILYLKPASTEKSIVVRVRDIKKGDPHHRKNYIFVKNGRLTIKSQG